MNTLRICERCRAPLAPDSPQGICPACLLNLGLASATAAPPGAEDSTLVGAPAPGGGAPPARAGAPRPGGIFGPYQIIRVLGRGGMGEVFEAEHTPSGRRVALKVMSHALPSDADRRRFLREGRLAASVSHPNAVYIFGSEEVEGTPVIAMELVAGGTLKDRLKRSGPLAITDAVAAALDIIEGLEAAAGAGVLHRDIKPANCFVTADGVVKVGDFGLSISTLARGESLLTASGSVVGTPAYASPEQLRGGELDVASDIYSVGATLFHLLTGRPPHEATDFVKLITEVLDKAAPAPEKLRPEIPGGLSRIVQRCLAKDRAARFASYGELRQALLPFGAAAPTAAPLGLRAIAGMVDEFVTYLPALAFLILTGSEPLENFLGQRSGVALAVAGAAVFWQLIYYALPEGLWGASLGKALCGLRVTGPRRDAPGVGRASLRALIFHAPGLVSAVAAWFAYTGADYAARKSHSWTLDDPAWLVLFIVLWVTLRRRNGFAAVHDLASGTRVILRPATQPRPRLDEATAPAASPAGAQEDPAPAAGIIAIGPYKIIRPLGTVDGTELLLARDPVLRRQVWIHRLVPGSEPLPARRRDLSRPGRLRWLNGHRDAGTAWDAYEAPDGAPLVALLDRARPWAAVRFWLHDLAEEIAAGNRHESAAPVLALDRIWINAAGRAVLLDFAFPTAPAPVAEESAAAPGDVPAAQKFLHAVASLALRGGAPDLAPAAVPLPVREFLPRLAEARLDSIEILLGNLRSFLDKPAAVSRQRRAAALVIAPALALLAGLSMGAVVYFSASRATRDWPEAAFPGSTELHGELRLLEWLSTDAATSGKLRIHLATHHRELILNTNFWGNPKVAGVLEASHRAMAEEAVREHTEVSEKLRADADELAQALTQSQTPRERALGVFVGSGAFWVLFTLAALADALCVLMLGQGLFFRLLGLAAVTRTGGAAGRGRLLLRGALAWGFCYLAVPAGFMLFALLGVSPHWTSLEILIALGLPSIVLLAAAYAVWRPVRGLQDWLAGTSLVPR